MKKLRGIDAGGFGYVDEVLLEDDETVVARKTFHPERSPKSEWPILRKRFEREVRIQRSISHPNVMPILDADLDADPPWFTMPMASQTLSEVIAMAHHKGAFDATPWHDILAGVEEIHRLGYVHRDLKPKNILLVGESWVISDFGLILPATRDTTVLTATRQAGGTESYAAPEQATDFKNSPEQADIFALGCILDDASRASPVRVPYAQVTNDSTYASIIEKCTEFQPSRRFQTISALRSALFANWRTAIFPPPQPNDEAVLARLESVPDDEAAWKHVLTVVEQTNSTRTDALLRGIGTPQILSLAAADTMRFARLVDAMCTWAVSAYFKFSYTDIVGDRLLDAYKVSPVRLQIRIVLAALELAVSHNRFHVMGRVGAMLGPTADSGLADRLGIEIADDPEIREKLIRIEHVIRWPRKGWHERVQVELAPEA